MRCLASVVVSVACTSGAPHSAVPSAPQIVIEPNRPGTNDDLHVRIVGPSTDSDGLPITYRYAWTRDGVADSHVGADVPASATTRFEVWEVTVSAQNGVSVSDTVSAMVDISNTPPDLRAVHLSPDPAVFGDVLTATTEHPFDADGDPVQFRVHWTVDGVAVQGADGPVLSAGAARRGQEVVARVTPTDGLDDGDSMSSPALVVSNTPPTAPRSHLAPVAPVDDESVRCLVDTNATDADLDPLSYKFAWTRDAVAYVPPSQPDVVPPLVTQAGEVWTCTLTASDGMADGPASTSTATIAPKPHGSGIADTLQSFSMRFDVSFSPNPASCMTYLGVSPCDCDARYLANGTLVEANGARNTYDGTWELLWTTCALFNDQDPQTPDFTLNDSAIWRPGWRNSTYNTVHFKQGLTGIVDWIAHDGLTATSPSSNPMADAQFWLKATNPATLDPLTWILDYSEDEVKFLDAVTVDTHSHFVFQFSTSNTPPAMP